MEKFCPKCGKKVLATAKFCPHCGYNFALRNSDQVANVKYSRTQAKPHQKKGKTGLFVILILALLVLAGGGYYYWHQSQTSQVEKSNDHYSHQREHESAAKSHSSSSRRAVDHTRLSANLGPKGSAAAVTSYAAKNDINGWQSMADSDDLEVDLSTNDHLLDSLSATGQGMVYIVSNDGESGDRILVYTVDKDDTINIYSLPNDYDSDSTYDPVKSIAKGDMIDSINSDHYAAKVKSLQDKVTINQEDEN